MCWIGCVDMWCEKTVVSLNKIKDLGFRIYSMGGFAPSDFKIFVT